MSSYSKFIYWDGKKFVKSFFDRIVHLKKMQTFKTEQELKNYRAWKNCMIRLLHQSFFHLSVFIAHLSVIVRHLSFFWYIWLSLARLEAHASFY